MITVVIPVAGRTGDLVHGCLRHLSRSRGVSFEVLLVDNGSPVNLKEVAGGYGVRYDVIRFEENAGFTKAVNTGIRRSQNDVLLLNSDTRISSTCLAKIAECLQDNPRAAAVGPLTFDRGHQSLRRRQRRKQAKLHRVSKDAGPDKVQSLLREDTVSREKMLAFFCTLLRREAIEDVGLLDEDYWHGLMADDDWCYRAIQNGWECLLSHGAFCHHLHKQTFRRLKMPRDRWVGEARRKWESTL